ncbi:MULTISPECIES: ATP-binding protein [Thiorhodovibrio]|uniref:ATP-binding protein n=1 Tax=Thiorhodovibrio TaxID=61593 RepID=UPI0019126486|nr:MULTISPECIES: ATP-binding protein [Thiorhodovibrio]MBK5970045.1 two-component sensor histidine kinase [Thiorhodovibrio winogradskyi]WPL12971.1 Sensor protein QseC [Thiorhodovibrio litoralis]
MNSIRHRLLLSLLVVWATTWIAVAVISVNRSNHEVGELMDAQLAQTAHVLRQITRAGNLPDVVTASQALSPIGHAYESMISFQLWREETLISSFGAAPEVPLGHTPGFSNHDIADTQWRVFGLPTDQAGEILYVGQSYAIRQELIEYLTLHALSPILWSLPLSVLLIWLAVTEGLRPLRRLRSQITHRSAEQLDPIEMRSIPAEIRPLTAALNGLMKRLDRALSAERHFAADASHELRTPFAAIRTHAQIAQRSQDRQERDQALAQLIRGIDRASHLISQLLILSRLHQRVSDGEALNCSLIAVAAQVVEDKSPVAQAKKITLTLKTPPGEDALADIPPSPLAILLGNLLDNAIKYSPAGGQVQVMVLARRDHLLLHVLDSGPGIPAANRARVFDRFYRPVGQSEPGAGLGLSIVRRICDLYDTDIELLDADAGAETGTETGSDTGAGLLVEVRFRRLV